MEVITLRIAIEEEAGAAISLEDLILEVVGTGDEEAEARIITTTRKDGIITSNFTY